MKKCSKCGRDLPEVMFARNKKAKDGLGRWCRECMFEYYKSSRPNARSYGRRKQIPNNEELKALYEKEGYTLKTLAQKYGVSYFAIRRRLEKAGTSLRTPLQSRILSEKLGRVTPLKGRQLTEEQRKVHLRSLFKARLERAKSRTHRRISQNGYVYIYTSEGKYRFEHDIIAEQILCRPLEPNECVHHINQIKDDNRAENLMITNKSEHAKMHQRELVDSGVHHLTKLTPQQVLQIKQSEDSHTKLAKRFGVSKSAISSIKKGRTWKHIK